MYNRAVILISYRLTYFKNFRIEIIVNMRLTSAVSLITFFLADRIFLQLVNRGCKLSFIGITIKVLIPNELSQWFDDKKSMVTIVYLYEN